MNFRRTSSIVCIVLLHGLTACGDRGPTEYQLTGPTMGTTFSVTVVGDADVHLDDLRSRIHTTLDDVDRRMSTWREDSELVRFNNSQSTDWHSVSVDLCASIRSSLEIGKITTGAFDITVGRLVDMWGFGSHTVVALPSEENIQKAKRESGLQHIQTDCANSEIRKTRPGIRVDLSGYGKGHAADEIAIVLNEQEIENFLVEIGGDLYSQGRKANGDKWRVAIEMPDSGGQAIEQTIEVGSNAVATSGDYRNFFEVDGKRYSHTIDPRTGRPVTHNLASVTVLFDNAAIADGYATALQVLGPDAGYELAERLNIPAYFLVREGDSFTERMSPEFTMLVDP